MYLASSTALIIVIIRCSTWKRDMKINQNVLGGGRVFLIMVYLGYKKNCNFFFTLILDDKMVNEDNFS